MPTAPPSLNKERQNQDKRKNHNGKPLYQTGFGNTFESEVIKGALPRGRNNPRLVPFNLYTEQLSGTAFTCARASNRRTWLYRRQPSVVSNVTPFTCNGDYFGGADPSTGILDPNPFRWKTFVDLDTKVQNDGAHTETGVETAQSSPTSCSETKTDFISGTHLLGASGDPADKNGLAIYIYLFHESMKTSYMYNSDGDFLVVPQQGTLQIRTEVGRIQVSPSEICVLPRGICFSVHVVDEGEEDIRKDIDGEDNENTSSDGKGIYRGYILEVYKGHFELPELGPLGSNGLANARDFEYPIAWCENEKNIAASPCLPSGGKTTYTLLNKFGSKLWKKSISSSPFNVVAWHGNYLPYKYDLKKFCAVNSVTYDHMDPSIYTVLTCPGGGDVQPGTALCDFVIFPTRWMSTDENTFRPPWFHRNTMTEFMGLISGTYDAKTTFQPGGASLHSCMTPHGPDSTTYANSTADPCLEPTLFTGGLAFMFETSCMLKLSKFASKHACVDREYSLCWRDLPNQFAASESSNI